jgi:16S rRNA (uracil1498-N3)-methyltransferase
LEKGTELGMSQLWLFPGQRSERKQLTESQLEHMRATSIAAMKQCGRLYLPSIELKPPLLQWQKLNSVAFFGDLSSIAPLFNSVWKELTSVSEVLFFVGPEGGFTVDEERKLHEIQVQGVRLHKNILRTDTAALVALSLITHEL